VKHEEPLLRILERIPLPVVIASPVTAKILWVNRRLLEMYGVESEKALIGSSLLDFIQAPQAAKALADLARVVAGQSPPPVTYQLRRANGEYAAGQVASVPMRFRGHVAMLSFVTDVSERERLVRDLGESEERYRLLLDAMPSGVVVVADETIVYANAALSRALGIERTALIGQSAYDYVAEEYRAPVRAARDRMIESGEPMPAIPMELLRADGSRLSTTGSSTVIHWDGRTATQTLLHDVGVSDLLPGGPEVPEA